MKKNKKSTLYLQKEKEIINYNTSTTRIPCSITRAHLTLVRSLIRPLRLGGDSGQMPALAVLPVDESRVLGDAVVPDDDSALLPLDADLEVGAVGEVVVQELEDGVRLLLLEADDVTGDCGPVCQLECFGGRDHRRGGNAYTEG